jgi:hypothetical protein
MVKARVWDKEGDVWDKEGDNFNHKTENEKYATDVVQAYKKKVVDGKEQATFAGFTLVLLPGIEGP